MASERTAVYFIGGTFALKPGAAPLYHFVTHLGPDVQVERIDLRWGGLRSLKSNLEEVVAAIRKKTRAGDRVVIIGHSQGGVLAFAAAAQIEETVLAVALCAPFGGSLPCSMPGAKLIPAFHDMALGSPFLKELPSEVAKSTARFVAIHTANDLVVYPASSTRCDWPGVENVALPVWTNHLTSLLSKRLREILTEAIAACGTRSLPERPSGRRRSLAAS